MDLNTISSSVGGALRGAGLWVGIIFFLVLVALLLWLVYYLTSFNITCFVEERRSHGTFFSTRKAKVRYDVQKDGKNLLQRMIIFGEKKPVMFPQHTKNLFDKGRIVTTPTFTNGENSDELFKLFGTTKKGKMAVRMIKEGDEYTIIPFFDKDVAEYLRVTRPVRLQWANVSIKEGRELFANKMGFMEKYGSMIMLGATMMVILVIFIMLFNKFDQLEMMSKSIDGYASAVSEFAQAVRETGVQRVA